MQPHPLAVRNGSQTPQVIDGSEGTTEYWLVQTVKKLADKAGVGDVRESPGLKIVTLLAGLAYALAIVAVLPCAYLALLLLNANGAVGVLTRATVPYPRIWASAVAMGMLAVLLPQLRAYHPPAAATALLVTLGAYRMTGKTPLALAIFNGQYEVASFLVERRADVNKADAQRFTPRRKGSYWSAVNIAKVEVAEGKPSGKQHRLWITEGAERLVLSSETVKTHIRNAMT